ncbi:uncharacterized protein DUF397 [Actinomadura pelletieri DSM 43383]|uniref:Uncharacterized protein DUF397 n=1 Tax=Actinomadura pelletieri DSM 43383 TaxID=1120940 RepID=A0A495QH34_9ACTN|nr:DUF397 domain-containing protein [Actinomadura pelletieri]RKS71179.1 uncharacterized protein DUF397 [Actinomadura pelletieri DSM 43383]
MEELNWRKSTRSGTNGENCVELARKPTAVAVRDSKTPEDPHHTLSVAAMAALFEEIRRGRYDLT